MKITYADIIACGGCLPGIKTFFKQYGLDFRAFIKNEGIDAEELRKCNNAISDRVIAYKERLEAQHGQK